MLFSGLSRHSTDSDSPPVAGYSTEGYARSSRRYCAEHTHLPLCPPGLPSRSRTLPSAAATLRSTRRSWRLRLTPSLSPFQNIPWQGPSGQSQGRKAKGPRSPPRRLTLTPRA